MRLIEIAAIGQNRELGKNNQMIWHLPADLKFFRNETAGHAIVMGRKTFESLPKMLPGRHHIVISKTMAPLEDVEIFHDPEQFFRAYEQRDEDVFVIGGGQLYKTLLPYADELVLTHIDAHDDSAQVFFPAFEPEQYESAVIDEKEDNGILTRHVRYVRKKN